MPRILFIDPMACHGGQERHILYLMQGLEDFGFEVGIAIGRDSPWHETVRERWGPSMMVVDYGSKFSSQTLAQLCAIAREGYDLVHSHGGRGGIYGRRVAHRMRMPVVQTWHLNPDEWAGERWFKRRLYYAGEKMLARHTTHYIAVSNQIRDRLQTRYGVNGDRVTTILNRVPRVSSHDGDVKPMPNGRPIQLLAVGRLTEQKGFSYLLGALHRLREKGVPFQMKIAGEGELRPSLEGLAKRFDLSQHIEFLGYVDPIDPWYRQADIFVLSSLWEGTPLVLLEAVDQHLRIVATDVGGTREILASYPLAMLVPARSAEALADAILAVRCLEPDKEPNLDSLFDVEAMVKQHVAVYQRVLSLPSRTPHTERVDVQW